LQLSDVGKKFRQLSTMHLGADFGKESKVKVNQALATSSKVRVLSS
jgi:hypothetical protein